MVCDGDSAGVCEGVIQEIGRRVSSDFIREICLIGSVTSLYEPICPSSVGWLVSWSTGRSDLDF